MAYNPQDDGIVIAKPLGALGFPIDSRSTYVDKINILRRSFISLNEVLNYFDTPLKRDGGFIIYVNDTGVLQPDGTILGGEDKTYWFKQGTADADLVPFAEKGDKGDEGNPGPQGEAFTYDDFTPEQIEELQQPAIDAAVIANTAALNANDKAVIAQNAATSANTAATTANNAAINADNKATLANNAANTANTATTNTNNATTAANTATTNANTATTQANTARDSANAAAIVANNARGWSPDLVGEADGADRQVFKLRSWINGTGTAPTDNVGLYLKSDGTYTAVKADAGNFKGEKGNNGIATPNINAGNLVGRTTVGFGSAEEIAPNGLTLLSGKVYNAIESGATGTKVAIINNPSGGLYSAGIASSTGAIKIKLPTVGANTTFVTIEGVINNNVANGGTTLFCITCYPNAMAFNFDAMLLNNTNKYDVRGYVDGDDRYVTIGGLPSVWAYLSVSINRVKVSHVSAEIPLFSSGWQISLITAFTGTLTVQRLENLPNPSLVNPITGYNPASGTDTDLTATMTPLQAWQNLQAQIKTYIKKAGTGLNIVLDNGTTVLRSTFAAFTATKLATPRPINGVDFDGSGPITIYDATKIPTTEKGSALGVATLDGGGKVPASQLPNSVMELQGKWNANTNTPTLADGTGNPGDVWEVTTAGTTNFGNGNITFKIGDWAVYGADGLWYLSKNSNEVTSVGGFTGAVTKVQLGIDQIDNTPDVSKPVSTPQQSAIDAKVEDNLGPSTTVAPSKTAVNAGLALKAPIREDIVSVTGNKTFALTDENKFQDVTANSSLTVPLNSVVAFPIGTEIEGAVRDTITGTFVATGGVTIINKSLIVSGLTAFTLKKVAADTWLLTTNASSGGSSLTGSVTVGFTTSGTKSTTVTVSGATMGDTVDFIRGAFRRQGFSSNESYILSGVVTALNTVTIYASFIPGTPPTDVPVESNPITIGFKVRK